LKAQLKLKTIEMHDFNPKSKQTFNSLYVINVSASGMSKNEFSIMIE